MAFATPKFPNSSKIHLFSFDPSCISFERVADVDDDDNHIDDNHIDDNHIDDMMMMTFLTGPPLFSTEMKKNSNEPTGAAVPILHERASGWLVSLFFILVLNEGGAN